jgi:DNA-binding MarR family transcriptional regulator
VSKKQIYTHDAMGRLVLMDLYARLAQEFAEILVEAAREKGGVLTAADVASTLNWSESGATAVLRRLVKAGRLESRRHKFWGFRGNPIYRTVYAATEEVQR